MPELGAAPPGQLEVGLQCDRSGGDGAQHRPAAVDRSRVGREEGAADLAADAVGRDDEAGVQGRTAQATRAAPADACTARTARASRTALESVRDPELREILVPRENAGRGAVRLFLAGHGVSVTDVDSRTHTLLTCVDGLVFDRLVNGGDVPREALESLVVAALRPAGRADQPVGTPASR